MGIRRDQRKILILYIGIGDGHRSAAINIKEELERIDRNVRVECRDVIAERHSLLFNTVKNTYLFLLKRFPFLWGVMYHSNEARVLNKKIINLVLGVCNPDIKKVIEGFKPDLVVATHAFYAGLVSYYKEKEGEKMPLVGVTTDFYVHNYWLYKNVDRYFVASEDAKKDLADKGIDRKKIVVSGIPINNRFYKTKNGSDVSISRLMVCGGSLGTGKIYELVKGLKESDNIFLMNVVTGRNKRLNKNIKRLLRDGVGENRVYRYTNRIEDVISKSSLYLGNAGGLMSNEVMSFGVPMIFYKPLHGQEKRNASYLEGKRVAKIAMNKKELLEVLDNLLSDPNKIKEVRQRTKDLSKPDASRFIVKDIVRMMR